jgi:hypothetical protein
MSFSPTSQTRITIPGKGLIPRQSPSAVVLNGIQYTFWSKVDGFRYCTNNQSASIAPSIGTHVLPIGTGVSAAVHDGLIYVFFVVQNLTRSNAHMIVSCTFDGTNWTNKQLVNNNIGAQAQVSDFSTPHAVDFDGALYVFWNAGEDSHVAVREVAHCSYEI